ncbi:TerC family protein [Liquorilactobacillus cacaonum]|uniref:TerC faamily membrane protein n=1 Tax=Liquorilactobacillus cacaonum DSM 21116 TaxID=1423729 RepID=A0A0R2CFP7_9LACO|nr:TerC family protein [Liquorilactobacillus cacaonum]KRM89938.1 TerC faamily membrane protein [Liquorilactobacillus cacaonum DSM 21116]
MEIVSKLYGPFFDVENWKLVIESGSDWLVILSLALIECLLSVDNAIVLAAQTKVLPTKEEQEKSLFFGLWGAYVFRFLIIGIGTYLINFWEIKIIGAGYLFYLAGSHFYHMYHPVSKTKKSKKLKLLPLFWSVVISIELMDIVFSIDSVLASLAISTNPVIVLIGGMIGILCMRGIAEIIIKLMEIIPELEVMAYALIGLIAIKLFISIPMIDIEIPAPLFAGIVLLAIIITFIVNRVRR